MDQETADKIEKHLKALVYFKVLQMIRQMSESGAFKEGGVDNSDQADAKMKSLLEKAYGDALEEGVY